MPKPEKKVLILGKDVLTFGFAEGSGRKLVTTDFNINLRHAEPCRASVFEVKKSLAVDELRAEWHTICAESMKRFVDLFPGPHVELATMLGWIDRFEKRQF